MFWEKCLIYPTPLLRWENKSQIIFTTYLHWNKHGWLQSLNINTTFKCVLKETFRNVVLLTPFITKSITCTMTCYVHRMTCGNTTSMDSLEQHGVYSSSKINMNGNVKAFFHKNMSSICWKKNRTREKCSRT